MSSSYRSAMVGAAFGSSVGREVSYSTAGSMSFADGRHWLKKESWVDVTSLRWPVARLETARPMEGSWRSVEVGAGGR